MLKIDRDSDGWATRLLLSGRIQSDCMASSRSTMNDRCTRKIMELSEITLVDIATIRFLMRGREN